MEDDVIYIDGVFYDSNNKKDSMEWRLVIKSLKVLKIT